MCCKQNKLRSARGANIATLTEQSPRDLLKTRLRRQLAFIKSKNAETATPPVGSQKEDGVGVPTPPTVLPTCVTVAVAEPVSQKKVLPTRAHVAVAEPVSQKEGGVVLVDYASPLSQVVCSHGLVGRFPQGRQFLNIPRVLRQFRICEVWWTLQLISRGQIVQKCSPVSARKVQKCSRMSARKVRTCTGSRAHPR